VELYLRALMAWAKEIILFSFLGSSCNSEPTLFGGFIGRQLLSNRPGFFYLILVTLQPNTQNLRSLTALGFFQARAF